MSTKDVEKTVKYLAGNNYLLEKREIIMRAIKEDQIKFLNTCINKWGDDFYHKIVPQC